MIVRITPTLSSTIAALNPALSLTPTTRTTVIASVIRIAGRLNQALTVAPEASVTVFQKKK